MDINLTTPSFPRLNGTDNFVSMLSSVIPGVVLNIVFVLCGTFLNGLVILCFWRSPQLNDKLAHFLTKVPSCADLLTVITTHPLFLFYWLTRDVSRRTVVETVGIIGGLSSSTLFLMNIERYLAVFYPYIYERVVTKRKLLITVSIFYLLWTSSRLIALYQNVTTQLTIFVIVSLLFETTFVYLSIFLIARKPLVRPSQHGSINPQTRSNLSKFLCNLKLAKTYFLTVATLFVFYLPIAIVRVLEESNSYDVERGNLGVARDWATNVIFINSTMNSLIFFWKNRQLREQGYRICLLIFCNKERQTRS